MTGDSVGSRNYRALIKRSTSPSGGTLLHLIRDDSEASLCGIPAAKHSPGKRVTVRMYRLAIAAAFADKAVSVSTGGA
jgi:hypothetical protein